MTIFELLSWLVLGAVVGVLVAAFWRTEGLTWIRALGIGVFGGVVGGLIGRILFVPGPFSGELGVVAPALLVAGIGAVVTVFIARFQLRNRERPRFS
ncbi:MAG TPA: hypothetical protein VMT11_21855 [Myxococcaceae bacterium]|nr:hypothetical protein [Myxococcaceae bacterium]